MLPQITTFATNWTSSLNRLSIGALAVLFLSYLELVPGSRLQFGSDTSSQIDLPALGGVVVFLIGSQVMGMIVVSLGREGFARKALSEESRVRRSHLVGQTQNPLLMDLCRDAHSRAELSTGVMGLLTFCVLAAITAFTSQWLSGGLSVDPSREASIANISVLPAIIFALFLSWRMRKSTIETLEEIDASFCGSQDQS